MKNLEPGKLSDQDYRKLCERRAARQRQMREARANVRAAIWMATHQTQGEGNAK